MSDDSQPIGELRRAAIAGLSWTVIARPVVELVLLGSMVVLARLIPPADFGRFAVALVAGELLFVPAQSVGTALVQRTDAGPEHLRTGVALSFLIGGALAAITLVLASVLVEPIFGGRTAVLVRLTTISCVLTSAGIVPSAILQRRLEFKRLSLLDVTSTVVRSVGSIAFALAIPSALALVYGGIVSAAVATGLNWIWAPPPAPRFYPRAARELGAYGGPAALAAISWVGFRNCDYAIVGARLGALPAGLYFRAYTLGVEYQRKVSQVMSSVGFPLLARAQTAADQDLMRGRMVRLLTLVLFPALVLLAVLAPVLIPWLFGPRWLGAAVPTQILALGGASTLVIDAVGAALMASGRVRAILGYGWAHFVAYAAAVVVASPLGITAVAVAAAVVHTAFLGVAYVLLVHSRGDRAAGVVVRAARTAFADLAPATLCSAVMAAVCVPLEAAVSRSGMPAAAHIALVSAVGASAYLAAMRVLHPASLRALTSVALKIIPRPARIEPGIARADTPGT